MTVLHHDFQHSLADVSTRGLAVCKQILNIFVTASDRSMLRRRFAALSVRDLDDIGLTVAQRDDMLR